MYGLAVHSWGNEWFRSPRHSGFDPSVLVGLTSAPWCGKGSAPGCARFVPCDAHSTRLITWRPKLPSDIHPNLCSTTLESPKRLYSPYSKSSMAQDQKQHYSSTWPRPLKKSIHIGRLTSCWREDAQYGLCNMQCTWVGGWGPQYHGYNRGRWTREGPGGR